MPPSPIKFWDHAKPMRLVVAFLGEFVGTCLLVFIGCGFFFVTDNFPRNYEHLRQINEATSFQLIPINGTSFVSPPETLLFTDNLLRNCLALGCVLSGVVLMTNPISGGHINPAVSFAFLILGKASVLRTIGYVFSQCLGSVVASGLLYAIFSFAPGGKEPFGCNNPAPFIGDFPAIVVEAAATFVLVFTIVTICHVIELSGKPSNRPPILLVIALFGAVTITVYVAAPFTGGSLNPARSFGPAIIWGCWERHYVYWFGPLAGSIFAAIIFYLFTVQIEEIDAEAEAKKVVKKKPPPTHDIEMQPLLDQKFP